MIKACIFDLDGTLLDTLETIRYYVNTTISKYGIEPITHEECRRFVGKGARNLMTRVLGSRGKNTPELFDEIFRVYNAAYDAAPYYLTRPYDGTVELIERLSGEKIKLAVLSNKPDFATRAAINHFFGDVFTIVRGGTEGTPLKPAASAADPVLTALGCTADEVAFVGDSDVDVEFCKAFAPALPLIVDWGFRTEEELLSSGAQTVYHTQDELFEKIISFR
jgi:phosphoglycolate phosphatase